MRSFAIAVVILPLLLSVAVAAPPQAGKPADWLPYETSPEMPRKVKPKVLNKIRSGMTLAQVVDLLGKGWVPPGSGTGIVTWGCTDGRNLKVWPKRYTKDEIVSFDESEDAPARMWIDLTMFEHR